MAVRQIPLRKWNRRIVKNDLGKKALPASRQRDQRDRESTARVDGPSRAGCQVVTAVASVPDDGFHFVPSENRPVKKNLALHCHLFGFCFDLHVKLVFFLPLLHHLSHGCGEMRMYLYNGNRV